MSTQADTQAKALPDLLDSNSAAGQKAARTRWWFIASVVVIAPLVLVVAGILAVVLWIMGMHGAALRKVEAEVARIQAAGEPITLDELYAHSRVPAGTKDITPLWMTALNSLDEQKFNADGKSLPIVGEVPGNELPAADVAAAEALLAKWDFTVQATLVASRAEGECRIPVEFKDGFSAVAQCAEDARPVANDAPAEPRRPGQGGHRRGRRVGRSDVRGIAALSHQMLLIEHLVRLATAGMALREVERLLNEAELTDQQLNRLKAHVQALDFQQGQIRSLYGERGMGYHMFRHSEQFDMAQGDFAKKANAGEGAITRAADCLVYLDLQKELIAAAGEPFPDAFARADQVEMRLKTLAGSRNPLERYNHMFTLLIMPAMNATLQATGPATWLTAIWCCAPCPPANIRPRRANYRRRSPRWCRSICPRCRPIRSTASRCASSPNPTA